MPQIGSNDMLRVDELLLDWALCGAEPAVRSTAAQHVRPDGKLVYAVPLAEKLVLVASDGVVRLVERKPPFATRPTFSPPAIRRFRDGRRLGLAQVIERVHELLVSHIWFAEGWQPALISIWVVGTFLHQLFAIFGYLHLTSATKRCGKSQLLDLLSHLCFNATQAISDPSPAFIFRDAERNCGTQLFDEVEQLGGAGDQRRASLLAILNAGFKRGAGVSRASGARGDGFREFNVYAPRVLAGIRKLGPTLADRSFRIELVRKHPDQRTQRFNLRLQAGSLARLRDDLHIAALSNAPQVAAWYGGTQDLGVPPAADDRLRDILEPLFAIASAADFQTGTNLRSQALIIAARALSRIRAEEESVEDQLSLAHAALQGICETEGRGIVISARGALEVFRQTEGLHAVGTLESTRSLLRRLGFNSAVHRRERFWHQDQPDAAKPTARGYEIAREKIRSFRGGSPSWNSVRQPSTEVSAKGQADVRGTIRGTRLV
jgi:hypothetical protein